MDRNLNRVVISLMLTILYVGTLKNGNQYNNDLVLLLWNIQINKTYDHTHTHTQMLYNTEISNYYPY